MSCDIVIRVARLEDAAARAELVHRGFASHRWEAFILFFFQELTLQLCVLGGAVLFIFCGVSVAGLGALLPAAAAAVALSVLLAHQVLADKHVQNMRKEMIGFIAELRGPLMVNPATAAPTIVMETEQQRDEPGRAMYHSQVVGTVSIAEFWGPRQSGWMQALAVHPDWRRRGIGRALAAAVRGWAQHQGLESLECIASELQPHVRALTHQAGWEVRGWYHRRLLGAALTLMVAHLGLDLPHA